MTQLPYHYDVSSILVSDFLLMSTELADGYNVYYNDKVYDLNVFA